MFIVEWLRIGSLLSFNDIDVLIISMVPMAVFIIPMSLIFSTLMVLERLSSESEIIAMKACGVKGRSIFLPIIGLSFVCMVGHMFITTQLGPLSLENMQKRLIQDAPSKIYSILKEREFDNTFKGLIVYIESVNRVDRELNNVYIETTGKQGSIITAESGTLDVASSNIMMRLNKGSMYMDRASLQRYVSFDEYMFTIEADFARELRLRQDKTATQPVLKNLIRDNPDPRWVKEYHNRYAFPVLNLILGFTGIIFGVQKPRSPKYTGFIVGIGTILGYYMAFLFADRLVKGDIMDPCLGAWVPNMIFLGVIGTLLIWRRSNIS